MIAKSDSRINVNNAFYVLFTFLRFWHFFISPTGRQYIPIKLKFGTDPRQFNVAWVMGHGTHGHPAGIAATGSRCLHFLVLIFCHIF